MMLACSPFSLLHGMVLFEALSFFGWVDFLQQVQLSRHSGLIVSISVLCEVTIDSIIKQHLTLNCINFNFIHFVHYTTHTHQSYYFSFSLSSETHARTHAHKHTDTFPLTLILSHTLTHSHALIHSHTNTHSHTPFLYKHTYTHALSHSL